MKQTIYNEEEAEWYDEEGHHRVVRHPEDVDGLVPLVRWNKMEMIGYDITKQEYSILLNDLWKNGYKGQLTKERIKELIPRLKELK